MQRARQAKEDRADRAIAFIETYLRIPEGAKIGQPFILDKFQKRFIRAVYGGQTRKVRRAILSMARKNGKTALIAAILLVHLVGPEAIENSQIVSGAQSREQASIVFGLAAKMVRMSEVLSPLVRIIDSRQRLYGLPLNVEYRALSSEGKTAHGLSPILAILDEVGQVRGVKDAFIDAIVTSQGAHENPLLLVISTQAENDTDLLSVWIDDAMGGNDATTICHLYAADRDADVLDKKAMRAANPALGTFRSIKDLEMLAQQAKRMPSFENTYRNLNLNQRISANSPFVSRNTWTQCNAAPLPLSECDLIYGGLDLSSKTDLTALVLLGVTGQKMHAHCWFWTPEIGLLDRAKRDRAPYDVWKMQGFLRTTPGATVDYEFVAQELAEISDDLHIEALLYDRWRMDILKKELDRIGLDLPLVPCGQGFKDMSPCIEALEQALLNVQLHHGNHPVLNMCAGNAVTVKDPAGNRKLDKSKATGRIDGITALAMSCGAAQASLGTGSLDNFLDNPLIL